MSDTPNQKPTNIEEDNALTMDSIRSIGALLAACAHLLQDKRRRSLRRPSDLMMFESIVTGWVAIVVAFLCRSMESRHKMPLPADVLRRGVIRPPQTFAAP